MDNLISMVEAWIDDRIMAKSECAFVKRRLDDLEYLSGVNSRTVSRLESDILLLKEAVMEVERIILNIREELGQGVSDSDVLQRLDTIDTTVENITDTIDTAARTLYDLSSRVDDLDNSFGDVDSDKVSCTDLNGMVVDILNEVQLPVTASPIVR